jgi:hypothetical protein
VGASTTARPHAGSSAGFEQLQKTRDRGEPRDVLRPAIRRRLGAGAQNAGRDRVRLLDLAGTRADATPATNGPLAHVGATAARGPANALARREAAAYNANPHRPSGAFSGATRAVLDPAGTAPARPPARRTACNSTREPGSIAGDVLCYANDTRSTTAPRVRARTRLRARLARLLAPVDTRAHARPRRTARISTRDLARIVRMGPRARRGRSSRSSRSRRRVAERLESSRDCALVARAGTAKPQRRREPGDARPRRDARRGPARDRRRRGAGAPDADPDGPRARLVDPDGTRSHAPQRRTARISARNPGRIARVGATGTAEVGEAARAPGGAGDGQPRRASRRGPARDRRRVARHATGTIPKRHATRQIYCPDRRVRDHRRTNVRDGDKPARWTV